MTASTVRFAVLANLIGDEARRLGHVAPTFSSPPRIDGALRSVRRRPGAPAAVAVRIAGRERPDVASDMIEGVVVANALIGVEADRCRAALWAVVEAQFTRAA